MFLNSPNKKWKYCLYMADLDLEWELHKIAPMYNIETPLHSLEKKNPNPTWKMLELETNHFIDQNCGKIAGICKQYHFISPLCNTLCIEKNISVLFTGTWNMDLSFFLNNGIRIRIYELHKLWFRQRWEAATQNGANPRN